LVASSALAATVFCVANDAHAEKILAETKDFSVYIDGRVGGFFSWAFGDGAPQPAYAIDPNGNPIQIHTVKGGVWSATEEGRLSDDPVLAAQNIPAQGKVNMMRVRSGFISNILGVGLRMPLTETTMVSTYVQFWAFAENEARYKTHTNFLDARQGYGKIEGPWGSFIAGRTRGLFSRGATDIDVQYGHKYGVGFPNKIDSNGPTAGMIGFGVMGSGFVSGLIYGTPKLAGFQLNAGIFDPVQLSAGGWTRSKYVRPEAELTYELDFSDTGKVILFGNGVYQDVYKNEYCQPKSDTNPFPCDETAWGAGYGGRLEIGPARLGVTGFKGKGLGLGYALQNDDASIDPQNNLRDFDGYYGQTMFVFNPVDVFAGVGMVRVFLTDADKERVPSPADPTGATMIVPFSVIKRSLGINAGVVYHLSDFLHLDADYFRAQADWYLGEKRVINAVNAGMTVTW
jgi:hypothetical protein